jgi:hypothetical protein
VEGEKLRAHSPAEFCEQLTLQQETKPKMTIKMSARCSLLTRAAALRPRACRRGGVVPAGDEQRRLL